MKCVCDVVARYAKEKSRQAHSKECEEYNQKLIDETSKLEKSLLRDFRDTLAWRYQEHPCNGPGYAHGPHGACGGWSTDRT